MSEKANEPASEAREAAEAFADRAAAYGLLARLFNREIDDALLVGLKGMAFPHDGESAEANEGARLMNAYLSQAGSETRTELAVDFARLFLVRTRSTKRAAYPFESVWTSRERTMMDNARDSVVAAYRRAGLARDDSWNLPEDHISLELEFMQALSQRCADAALGSDEEMLASLVGQQRDFMRAHLISWTGRFAEVMAEMARTDFYRGLAKFLTGFLAEDAEFLAVA